MSQSMNRHAPLRASDCGTQAKNEAGFGKSIAIVLPDLRHGGAEKLHVNLANEWLSRGVAVEFVLGKALGQLLTELPDQVTVADLGAARVRSMVLPLIGYLRNCRADVVLAAMWPLTVLVPLAALLAGFKGRVAVSEHSPLSIAYARRGKAHGCALRASTRFFYPLATRRIAVSMGVAEDLASLSGLPRDWFTVIYNPAASGQVREPNAQVPEALSRLSGPLILSVGTLKRVKRHDLLIRAFSRLPPALSATLCIVGEGAERPALERLVAALGLEGRVLLPGFASPTGPWYAAADLFVLASDYEGFGNVLVEAMEQGVPVVSTDCPSGPREILCDGKYGRLVPVNDPDALASAMQAALAERPDRSLLQARAGDFAVERIADQYLDVLLPDWRNGGRT